MRRTRGSEVVQTTEPFLELEIIKVVSKGLYPTTAYDVIRRNENPTPAVRRIDGI
jgi:hypothetical protein